MRKVILELNWRTFRDSGKAISEADTENVKALVPTMLSRLREQRCEQVAYEDRIVILAFRDACLVIAVSPEGSTLMSNIGDRTLIADRNIEQGDEYLRDTQSGEHVWDRKGVLKMCVNAALKNIYYNGNELFLYFAGWDKCLSFVPAKDTVTGDAMLYYFLVE